MPAESASVMLKSAHDALLNTVHVGVLVPWANTIVEDELPRLGLDQVIFHYSRLVPASQTTNLDDRFLRELACAAPGAVTALSRLPLTRTLLACTSVGFTSMACGLPVVTAFDALVTTLHRMSTTRIVLITPYPAVLTELEAHALEQRGFVVVAQSSLNRSDGYAQVSPAEIHRLIFHIEPAMLSRAQAIVLSCTGWPTRRVLGEIEDLLGIPVISSNLAMAIAAVIGDGIT